MLAAKVPLTAILLSVVSFFSSAQNAGSIRGSLHDSADKKIISLATVTVFTSQDTNIVSYRLSDPSGKFRVPGVPLSVPCRLIISFSGYKSHRKEFLLTPESPSLDLGQILMVNNPQNLDEIVVLAERPPVSIRKDTIEFNTSAFKTLPSALLEDLLKKLPGIDVDENGNITVKGKRVNRLLVDGKNFFGGQPQIASRNLPADIVDKVQVMNDKEEIDRDPNLPENEIGQVINIKLRPGIKEGWFGKSYFGGGTNSRKEAGAIVNLFRDTMQVSLLVYANNINKPGFGITDLQKIGGFQRGGISAMTTLSDGGYELNGITFGSTAQGLQRSTGGGINYNNQFGMKLTLNLQYFYGQINSEQTTLSNQQRFFMDTVLLTRANSETETVSMNHRVGGTLIWKIDSSTTLTFRPSMTMRDNTNINYGNTVTDENFRGQINRSTSRTKGKSKSGDFSNDIYVRRVFRKRGRSLSLSSNLNAGNNILETYNDGIYTLFFSGLPEDSLVNQLRSTAGKQLGNDLNILFTEPLSKKITLSLIQNSEYMKEENTIDFFGKDQLSGKYDLLNQLFSNVIWRKGWKNTSTALISYSKKKFRVTTGINYLNASFENRFSKNAAVSQRFNFLYPSLSISKGILNLSYRATIQEPRVNLLQDVIDISNRFYQQFGNPNLKPEFLHNLSLTASKFNVKTGSSYNTSINVYFGNNTIIYESSINPNGIRSSRPINVNGTYGINSNSRYNYQYKLSQHYKLNITPLLFLNYRTTQISVNKNLSEQKTWVIGPSLALGINYQDKIELSQRYNPIYRQTTYGNNKLYRNINVLTHSLESELVVRLPKQVIWENLINYRYNPQVATGIRKSSLRWNAAVSYLFLKQDKGQLKLSVFDLLKQNLSVTRSVSENYISDSQSTTLTRYFMLSFIYNIRNFSTGKVGGKERSMFLF